MDLNLVVLAGRLAAPPELRAFDGGSQLLRFLLMVRSGLNERLDVLPVTLWNPEPSQLDADLHPGSRIWITGSAQRRFWEASDGRRSRIEIVADRVQIREHEDAEGDITMS